MLWPLPYSGIENVWLCVDFLEELPAEDISKMLDDIEPVHYKMSKAERLAANAEAANTSRISLSQLATQLRVGKRSEFIPGPGPPMEVIIDGGPASLVVNKPATSKTQQNYPVTKLFFPN